MTNDLARALAFSYKRKGTDTMERSKLLAMLAFDLRWFSPDSAKRIIQKAIEDGLLHERGDALALAFDADAVDIPLNFKPREDALDHPGTADLPSRKLAALPPADAEAEAERARRGGLVTLDVARLLVDRRKGQDVAERAKELEKRILSG